MFANCTRRYYNLVSVIAEDSDNVQDASHGNGNFCACNLSSCSTPSHKRTNHLNKQWRWVDSTQEICRCIHSSVTLLFILCAEWRRSFTLNTQNNVSHVTRNCITTFESTKNWKEKHVKCNEEKCKLRIYCLYSN